MRAEIRAGDMDRSPAFGPQVADAGGHGREGVDRIAKLVQADGLDVKLQIRGRLVGAGFREDPQLAGCHGHGTGPFQQVFQPDGRLAQQT